MAAKTKTVADDWYKYPQYCDLALGTDTRLEADFVEAACKKYCGFRVRRLLEPACGGGRLVVELARRGYQMTAFDACEPAVAYARKRLARRRLAADVFVGEMVDFRLARPVDAALNPCNSFRHLLTESAARAHLESVARALRPGGIYVIGLHLMPPDADPEDCERWTVRSRGTTVTTTMRVMATQPRRRLETLRTTLSVRAPKRRLRIVSEFQFRLYSAPQMLRLLASVPQFELCGVFDFWYDINYPRQLDDVISDTVLVLRKRLQAVVELGTA